MAFSRHIGQGTLAGTWVWWYVLRPFTGVALAFLVYFVIRGGLLTTGFGGEALSPYGVAAIAGLQMRQPLVREKGFTHDPGSVDGMCPWSTTRAGGRAVLHVRHGHRGGVVRHDCRVHAPGVDDRGASSATIPVILSTSQARMWAGEGAT